MLDDNQINSKGIKHLIAGNWPNLRILNVGMHMIKSDNNPLCETGLQILLKHKISKRLKSLSIQSCQLTS